MAGLGPVPLAGLMLAELGADVVRIERTEAGKPFLAVPPQYDLDRHGREVLKVDLKRPEGIELMLRLAETADVLLEGFRPGVMERLGLGPDDALARNPRLIYGRMTGFGQDGPLAARAGHDLTYLAYSGVLHAIGSKDGKPVPPLNLVGDYGGGTMFLIMGVLAALFERARSGKGQVIDAAMIDGASMLAAPFFSFLATGFWNDRRGVNLLDSGAPFYDTYETSRRQACRGRLPRTAILRRVRTAACRSPENLAAAQYDRRVWDEMRGAIAARIKEKTRDEWTAVFEATDACVAPVLSLTEAPAHEHNRARQTHVAANGFERPAPAPRFSRTPAEPSSLPVHDPAATLSRFGIGSGEAEALTKSGTIG